LLQFSQENNTLQKLVLIWCGIGDVGVAALAEGLKVGFQFLRRCIHPENIPFLQPLSTSFVSFIVEGQPPGMQSQEYPDRAESHRSKRICGSRRGSVFFMEQGSSLVLQDTVLTRRFQIVLNDKFAS